MKIQYTPWLTINNKKSKGKNTAIIDIDGAIGFDWYKSSDQQNTADRIKKELKALAELKADEIIVNIRSLGGSVDHGLSIHDYLKSNDADVITRVWGATASAATIISQAGAVRQMSANALFLAHHSWNYAIGNAIAMRSAAENLDTWDKRILDIYTKRSGKSEDEISELMDRDNGNGVWIDADETLEFGLIDEIFEPSAEYSAVAMIQSAPSNMISLPPLPEDYLSRFPAIENKAAGAPPPDNPKTENNNTTSNSKTKEDTMDPKAQIKEWGALFGAEFALNAISSDMSFEDAAKDFIGKQKDSLATAQKELAESKDSLATAQKELDAANATIKELKDESPALPAGHVQDTPKPKEDAKPTATERFNAAVKAKTDAGMSKAEAISAVYGENPGLRDEYLNESNKRK